MENLLKTLQKVLTPFRLFTVVRQLDSVIGTSRTEELRIWDRNDTERQHLLVFVHGFMSSKEDAWGNFLELIKADPDFTDFNLHRFGYRTKLAGQIHDVQHEGEFLSSFLKKTVSSYQSTTIVGHSMGGLVILHALLNLERDQYRLLKNANIKVVTFGTPYLGVKNAGALATLLSNKQANDMQVFGDHLVRLRENWDGRFNRSSEGGREALRIPIFAYSGNADDFVAEGSARGAPGYIADRGPVDGDHRSMVKPNDNRHLAYLSLKTAVLQKTGDLTYAGLKPCPTPEGRLGVWVARISGDSESHQAQRHLIRSLEYYIHQEKTFPMIHIEVAALPQVITGNTTRDEEAMARCLGREVNAAIIVWGEMGGFFKKDQFHPRVIIVKPLEVPTITLILPVITEISQSQPLNQTIGTVMVPPEPVKQPLQLARLLVAMALMEKQEWADAARQLDHFISGGLSNAVRTGDIYTCAGVAHACHASDLTTTQMTEALVKSRDAFEKAIIEYREENDRENYIGVHHSLGHIYRMLAQCDFEPKASLQHSLASLLEAAREYERCLRWENYAEVQFLLAATYIGFVQHDLEPQANLQHARDAYRKAAVTYKEIGDSSNYAQNLYFLGMTYDRLAKHDVEPEANLLCSLEPFKEAALEYNKLGDWARYAEVKYNLGKVFQSLAERDVEPEANLLCSLEPFKEAALEYNKLGDWARYGEVKYNLGKIYRRLAERHVAPQANLQLSTEAFLEATLRFKEISNWAWYALVQYMLVENYVELSRHGLALQNIQVSLEPLEEAARHYKELADWNRYARLEGLLAALYRILAERGIEKEQNLQRADEASKESKAYDRHSGTGC